MSLSIMVEHCYSLCHIPAIYAECHDALRIYVIIPKASSNDLTIITEAGASYTKSGEDYLG